MSHHHHHDHPGAGADPHRLAALAPWAPLRRNVHRIGRRRFLADLGRGTFAIAILGAAACSSSDDSTSSATTTTAGGDADQGDRATDDGATEGAADNGPDTSPDTSADVRADSQLTWSQVSLGFVSAYVLGRGSQAAVVDTGVPGSAPQIGEALAGIGLGWGDVDHVVLTHHHPDHVGSLNEVLLEAPSATAYAGEADIASIESSNPLVAVGDGDELLGLQVLNTPGHTPGSISLLDPGIGLLVAGDALTAAEDGSTVLAPSEQFSDDIELAFDTVRSLAELDIEAVLVGHGAPVESGGGTSLSDLADSL